ncbi:MAG: N(4)-(beta-N-acetylglucosaminyl)-L-asparaginase [Saprospiraceae bacterium]|nr:N(4)-(beta-N-acetylglucosaminyl)-L-asparaginase [Saprospiraceae bacterium]
MKNRRSFLMSTLAFIPVLDSILQPQFLGKRSKERAFVISTWDSGKEVNEAAFNLLNNGEKSIDAVEAAGTYIENQINCCVGLGGNPDREGKVTLDACIMDHKFQCGSVSFLERIKHPVSLARKVMEKTPHVMFVGKGAQNFAVREGFTLEEEKLSPDAEQNYKNWLIESKYKPVINIENKVPGVMPEGKFNHDTMGTLCLDQKGNLAGMCTTSGMAFKMHGRVGDSPIIGGGLYVDGKTGAATATGQGEEVIRVCGTFMVVEYLKQGKSPEQACRLVIKRIIDIDPEKAKSFQVGFIALTKNGEFGTYSIHPGFSYAVTLQNGITEVRYSDSFFKN